MDNTINIINENVINGEENIPLENFFADLKENGFAVTPLQIINANKVIMQYANWVKNEAELCLYLSPIFAGTEEEQVLFKKIFNKHFKRETPKPPSRQQLSLEKKVKENWRNLLIIYGAVALMVIIIVVFTIMHKRTFNKYAINVQLKDKTENFGKTAFQIEAGNKIEVGTSCQYYGHSFKFDTDVIYDWGDKSPQEESPYHIYTQSGSYTLTAYIDVLYKNNLVKKDTLTQTVTVCPSNNSLSVIASANTDSVLINQLIKLKATTKTAGKNSIIQWKINDVESGTGNQFETSFATASTYAIVCLLKDTAAYNVCTVQKTITINVYKNKAQQKAAAIKPAKTIQQPKDDAAPDKKANKLLSALYNGLAILFGFLSLFFILLWLKELKNTGKIKSKALEQYNNLTGSFANEKTPAVIPFKNKNYLPVQESELDNITKLLRRRVKDTVSFLNINKTINQSIEKNGLFTPVMNARTRQSEYLILIDEYNSNSQQIKLMEYLVMMLKKQNVFIDTFYYKKYPGFCYSIHEPGGISLEKMFGKYQRHILLIFGNGYQLINKAENKFDTTIAAILNRWQHKAIVTPVSFLDWQQAEKNILLPHIPIVPVDMQGLVLLAEMLTEKENAFDIVARLNRNSGAFYKTATINFENIVALEEYCALPQWIKKNEEGKTVNVLMEWIAALAIYPKLRWEITLALGKALIEKYNLRNQLNFTLLLRIARISWMKDGFIKEPLRFELLKKLSLENEQLARETIVELLKEIPQKEIANSNAVEEKEVQQIINEFSLYAHDPVYYSSYKQSTYLFEKLLRENKLNDAVTESYLKNENKQWKTLINQQDNKTNATYNVGVEEYLQTTNKEETILSKVYLGLALMSIVVLVTSIAALRILFIWNNVL